MKKIITYGITFLLAVSLIVMASPAAAEIKWKPIFPRIDAPEYQLPEGWQEAVKGVDHITVFNSGVLLPPDPATAENAKIFTKLTGVKVRFLETPPGQLIPKQSAMCISKSPAADVLSVFDFEFETFMKAGWVAPLDKIWDEQSMAALTKSFFDVTIHEEKPYGVPNIMKIFLMNYRPNVLKKAGFSEPPKTWEEFLNIGEALTQDTNGDGKIDMWGSIWSPKTQPISWAQAFLYAAGGSMVQPDGEVSVLTKEMKQAFQFMQDQYKRKVVSPAILGVQYVGLVDSFNRGLNATALFGFELISQLKNKEILNDFAQAPFPAPPGGVVGASRAQFEILGLNPYSKKKDAALLYLDFKRSRQASRNELVLEKNCSFYLDVFNEKAVLEKIKYSDVILKAAKEARCEAIPFSSEVNTIIKEAMGEAILDQKPVDEVLEKAQKKIDDLQSY
jgi:multiple sugar transport system substrate-binding protein